MTPAVFMNQPLHHNARIYSSRGPKVDNAIVHYPDSL